MQIQSSRRMAFLYGLLPLLVTAGVVFVLTIVGGKAVQGYEMRQEARALERRIEELRKENRELVQVLEYYRSDEYMEKLAREELGLTRPGDVAVITVPSESSRTPLLLPPLTPVQPPPPAAREPQIWQKWLSMFVGEP